MNTFVLSDFARFNWLNRLGCIFRLISPLSFFECACKCSTRFYQKKCSTRSTTFYEPLGMGTALGWNFRGLSTICYHCSYLFLLFIAFTFDILLSCMETPFFNLGEEILTYFVKQCAQYKDKIICGLNCVDKMLSHPSISH